MAVTVTDRRTTYTEADSTTGWTPGSFGTVSDFAEGTLAVGESLATTNGEVYFTGSAIDLTNTLVYVYAFNNALLTPWDASPPPIALLLGDGSDLIGFDMAGSNRRVFNHLDGPTAWQCLVLDGDQADEMDAAGNTYLASGTFAGLDLANIVDIGCAFDTQSKALGGGYNVAVDIIRYGNDGLRITAGTTGDRGTFAEIAAEDRDTATLKAHGILRAYTTIAFGCQGPLTFGDSGTATDSYFEDTGIVFVFEDRNISDGKYYFNVEGHASATNSFEMFGSTITTAGPSVSMDYSGGDIDTLTFTGCVFSALGGVILFSENADASGHAVTSSTFDGCGVVTAGDVDFTNVSVLNSAGTTSAVVAGLGDLLGLIISGYEGTANTSALIYDQNVDPDGVLDGSAYTKGTAATHAIEFGDTIPATITLRDCTFTGYSASDAANDSTFHFRDTTGSITLNVVNCTGNFSFRTDGATITVVEDPVTLELTVTDINTGSAISGAQVLVLADTVGPLPFEDSVSIVQTSGTATVTHTAHGFDNNHWVLIEGCAETEYNRLGQITVTDANTYTYAVDSGAASPATGTPISTAAIIVGTTNGSGVINDTRAYGSDQDIDSGRSKVREGTAPGFYKSQPVKGTISSSTGLTLPVQLIPDE